MADLRIHPVAATVGIVGGAVLAYLAVSLLVAKASGSPVAGASAGALAALAMGLGYRRWSTGSWPAGPLPEAGRRPSFWALCLALLVSGFLFGQMVAVLVYQAIGSPAYDQNVASRQGADPRLLLLAALVLAPAGEEALMRMIAYSRIRTHLGVVASALVSAAVFAVLHGNMVQLVVGLVLGFCLALAYEGLGRLWPVVVGHSLFNLLAAMSSASGFAALARNPGYAIAFTAMFALVAWQVLVRLGVLPPRKRSAPPVPEELPGV